jgi:hypothetical protein
MRSSIYRLVSLTALVGAALSAQASSFVDDLEIDGRNLSLGNVTQYGWGYTNVNGMLRSEAISQTGNVSGGRSFIDITGGAFVLNNDAGVTSTGGFAYLLTTARDLSGTSAFKVDYLTNNSVGTVKVFVTDADYNTATYSAVAGVSASPFSVFATPTSGNIDLTRVTGVYFQFGNGGSGQTLSVGHVESVPEPATMAALGLGALGLLKRRRRA